MKILVFDNYDSFTYNLVHMIRELGFGDNLDVRRNDKITLEEVDAYEKILLSPGPGIPSEAGIMQKLINRYAAEKSILGVCLGHQGIAEVFGAKLLNMPKVLHGVATKTNVINNDEPLFAGVPKNFLTCRYHSWTVIPETVNGQLEITANDEDGNVLALRHKQYDVRGVQFHPESILTEYGKKMIENWLNLK